MTFASDITTQTNTSTNTHNGITLQPLRTAPWGDQPIDKDTIMEVLIQTPKRHLIYRDGLVAVMDLEPGMAYRDADARDIAITSATTAVEAIDMPQVIDMITRFFGQESAHLANGTQTLCVGVA